LIEIRWLRSPLPIARRRPARPDRHHHLAREHHAGEHRQTERCQQHHAGSLHREEERLIGLVARQLDEDQQRAEQSARKS